MFIRRTTIKSRVSGEPYFTYRLVESERVDGKVKQRTLINLGSHFDVARDQWPALCARIEQCLDFQRTILPITLSTSLEKEAQRYAARVLARRSDATDNLDPRYESVDIHSVELVRPRSVGVEHLALHAAAQLELTETLEDLGFNRRQRSAALGTIIGRMTCPGSEAATHEWLQNRSALSELIDYDFEGMSAKRLYEVSDQLWKHRDALQTRLYRTEQSLFKFEETITLYDLTNTYFEGESKRSALTQRGRSKEKRNDAPLVTLGLVLDGSGFPRRSRIFPGNASEPQTLEVMLTGLQAARGTIVVLDAGLASEANIDWLKENDYRYLVVSRKRQRRFDSTQAVTVKQSADQEIKIQRVIDPETDEVELYCHSKARAQKEQAIQDRLTQRFEAQIARLAEGLHHKGRVKDYDKVMHRIGRLKQKYARAAQHYDIQVRQAPDGRQAIAIQWTRSDQPGSQATHPGVYCLRTDMIDWDESTLWHTYTLLTDLEAVFRSLKTELGLRPIYHHKSDRISGHIFISLLAYHLVHTIRIQLKAKGIHSCWETIRKTVSTRVRVTASLRTREGKTLHSRQSTRAEPNQQAIYDALGIPEQAGVVQRTVR